MRVLLLFLLALSQQPAPIGSDEAIGFDYEIAEITRSTVTHFEAQWDGQTWITVGIPPVIAAGAPEGWNTYRVIPPFTTGTHTAAFRACNVAGCGGGSTPFRFHIFHRAERSTTERSGGASSLTLGNVQ